MTDDPFDRYAAEYDSWFERHRWAYLSELSALKQVTPSGRGIEIGVGTGRFASSLGINTGLDPSLPMLAMAKGRGVDVVRGVAEALPFKDGAFDLALMVTTLCFVPDPLLALVEARRVVRKGGTVVMAIIDRDSPLGRIYEQKAAGSRYYRNARFLSHAQLIALIERAGMTPIDSCQTVFSEPSAMNATDPVLEGHGNGLFAVSSAQV